MSPVSETIIEALVEEKNEIQITEVQKGRETVFEVKVSSKDMGRVIGKEGRIAKSIRTIFKAASTKEQKKVQIEFVD